MLKVVSPYTSSPALYMTCFCNPLGLGWHPKTTEDTAAVHGRQRTKLLAVVAQE